MKKIINLTLILILILASSSLRANADNIMSDDEVKSIISGQVGEQYKQYTDAQLKVEVVALPFKNLSLPDGQVTFVTESIAKKFMARTLEKVTVYVNDKFVKTFNAPILVKAYEDVLVASCFINIENPLNSDNVVVKKLEISNTLGYELKPESLNKEVLAKKAFREGEIIDKRFVKLKPDILRNAKVTAVFNTNNLTISTEAAALANGMVGDNICIVSKNYNKVYTGKIIGENKVLVKI